MQRNQKVKRLFLLLFPNLSGSNFWGSKVMTKGLKIHMFSKNLKDTGWTKLGCYFSFFLF